MPGSREKKNILTSFIDILIHNTKIKFQKDGPARHILAYLFAVYFWKLLDGDGSVLFQWDARLHKGRDVLYAPDLGSEHFTFKWTRARIRSPRDEKGWYQSVTERNIAQPTGWFIQHVVVQQGSSSTQTLLLSLKGRWRYKAALLNSKKLRS